ncbi:hypothetical protein SNE40_019817 [Patella caerulea]|uniref:Uncharacterized protein n=1 Tax=Patella caerulea TaxID=87958 RepID=A0AAN8J4I1_PATCE
MDELIKNHKDMTDIYENEIQDANGKLERKNEELITMEQKLSGMTVSFNNRVDEANQTNLKMTSLITKQQLQLDIFQEALNENLQKELSLCSAIGKVLKDVIIANQKLGKAEADLHEAKINYENMSKQFHKSNIELQNERDFVKSALDENNSIAIKRYDELYQKYQSVQLHIQEKDRVLNDYAQELQCLRRKEAELTEEEILLSDDIQKIKSEFEKNQLQRNSLESEQAALKFEVNTDSMTFKEIKLTTAGTIEESENVIDSLKKLLREMKQSVEGKNKVIDQLSCLMKKKEDSLSVSGNRFIECQTKLSESESENEQLQEKIALAHGQINKLTDREQNLNIELNNSCEKSQHYLEQISKLTEIGNTNAHELDTLKSNIQLLSEEKVYLDEQFSDALLNLDDMKEQNTTLMHTLQVSKEELFDLQTSKNQLLELKSLNKNLTSQLTHLETQFKHLQECSLQYEDKITHLEEENCSLKETVKADDIHKPVNNNQSDERSASVVETVTTERVITLQAANTLNEGGKMSKINLKKDAKILSQSRKIQELESKLISSQEQLLKKKDELQTATKTIASYSGSFEQSANTSSLDPIGSVTSEVVRLKKMLKKKEARITVLNNQLSELQTNLMDQQPTDNTLQQTTDVLQLHDANAKLFVEQERRDVLEKQLANLSTERSDLVIQLDELPGLRSMVQENETVISDLKKLNSELVAQNKELMKTIDSGQKTAETDSAFNKHLQNMLIEKSSRLVEKIEDTDDAAQKHLETEKKYLQLLTTKDSEIELLKQEVMRMTQAVIDKESSTQTIQSEIDYYKLHLTNLQQEIFSKGDTYAEQLTSFNGDIFTFMRNVINTPKIVIKEISDNFPEIADVGNDTNQLKNRLLFLESENQHLNEMVQKSQIQLQYEKDLAQSMSTRYKEEVKEISELRTQLYKLRKQSVEAYAIEEGDEESSTVSSIEQTDQYGKQKIARLTEKLHKTEERIEFIIGEKKDLELELDDLIDELHRKDDMLFQTKEELNSSCNFIDDLEADISLRDGEILALKDILSKTQADIFHMREELDHKENLLETMSPLPPLRAQSLDSLDEVSKLQKLLKKKDAKILALNKKVETLTRPQSNTNIPDIVDGKEVSPNLYKEIESLKKLLEEKDLQSQKAVLGDAAIQTSDVAKLRKLIKIRDAKILVLRRKLDEVTCSESNSLGTSSTTDSLGLETTSSSDVDVLRKRYTTDIYQKHQQIQEMTKCIADLQSNLSYHEQTLFEKENELVIAVNKLKEGEKAHVSMTMEQSNFSAILSQKDHELDILNQKWLTAKQNLEESYTEQDTSYNHYQLLETEKVELESQIIEMKKHHCEMSAYSEGLWNELGELKLTYETVLSEKEDLEIQVENLIKENDVTKTKLETLQDTIRILRAEKEKIDLELHQMKEDYEYETSDSQSKAEKIIELENQITKIEEYCNNLKQALSEKNVIIEQLVYKMNREQEERNNLSMTDQEKIDKLQTELDNALSKIEDLTETSYIQISNLESSKDLLKEKEVLIEQLQHKEFDTQSIADLQEALDKKETFIVQLSQETECLQQVLDMKQSELDELTKNFRVIEQENLNLKVGGQSTEKEISSLKLCNYDLEYQLANINQELQQAKDIQLEKDWTLHDSQKEIQLLKKGLSADQNLKLIQLQEEVDTKDGQIAANNILLNQLQANLHSLNFTLQDKENSITILTQEKENILMESKSWKENGEHLNSVLKLKDQDIQDLHKKVNEMTEYDNEMESELKNFYIKEQDYIKKTHEQSELIKELHAKLGGVESERKSQLDIISILKTQILDLNEQLKLKDNPSNYSKELSQLQNNLKKKEAKILNLNKKLKETQEKLDKVGKELADSIQLKSRTEIKEVFVQKPLMDMKVTEDLMVGTENMETAATQKLDTEAWQSHLHDEQISIMKVQIEDLKEDFEKAKATLVVRNGLVQELNVLRTNLETDLTNFAEENVNLKLKVEALTSSYQNNIARLHDEIKTLNEATMHNNQKMESMSQAYDHLKNEVHSYQIDIENKSSQIQDLTTSVLQKEQNIEQLTETITEMNSQIQNYLQSAQEQLKYKDEDQTVWSDRIAFLEKENKSLSEQLQDQKNTKVVIDEKMVYLMQEVTVYQDSLSSLQSQLVQSSGELEKSEELQQEHQLKIKALEESLQTALSFQESENSLRESLQSQLDSANRKFEAESEKSKELLEYPLKVKTLEQSLQTSLSVQETQRSEIESLHSQLNTTNNILEQLQGNSSEKEKEMLDMTQLLNQQLQTNAGEMIEIQSRLEESQKSLQESVETIKKKDDKILSLLGNFQEMEDRLTQLSDVDEQMSLISQELDGTKIELENKMKQLEEKSLTLKKAIATIKKLKSQLKTSEEKIAEMENSLSEESKSKQQLELGVEQTMTELEEKQSSLKGLKETTESSGSKDIGELQKQLQSYAEFCQQLQEQVQQLTDATYTSEQQLQEKQTEIDVLKGESTNLKLEIHKLKLVYERVQAEMSVQKKVEEDFNSTVYQKDEYIKELKKQIEHIDSRYKTLQEQHSEKEDYLLELNSEKERLVIFEKSVEDQLEELCNIHKELQEANIISIKDLFERLKSATAKEKESEEKIENLQKYLIEKEEEINRLILNIEKLSNESADAKLQEVEKLNDHINKLQQKQDAEEKEKQEMSDKLKIAYLDLQKLQNIHDKDLQENNDLEIKLQDLENEMKQIQSAKDEEISVYVESLNTLQQKLIEKEELLQETVKKFKNTMQTSSSDGTELKTKNIDYEICITSLMEENKLLKSEITGQVRALEDVEVIKEANTRLKQSLTETTMEYESLKLKYEETESEKLRVEKLNSQLQEETILIKEEFQMQLEIVENLQHLLKETQISTEVWQTQNNQLTSSLEELKTEKVTLSTDIETLQGQCEGLEQIIATARLHETEIQDRLSQNLTEIEKLSSHSKLLQEKIDELEARKKENAKEHPKEINYVERIESPMIQERLQQTTAPIVASSPSDTWSEKLKESHAERAALEDENRHVKGKLQIAEVKCEKMLHKLKAFKDKNDKLMLENESLKNSLSLSGTFDEVKEKLNRKEEEYNIILNENSALKISAEDLNKQIVTLQQTFDIRTEYTEESLMKEREHSKQHTQALQGKICEMNTTNEEVLRENLYLKNRLETADEELMAMQRNNKELLVQNETFSLIDEALNHKLKDQVDMIEALKGKLQQAKDELDRSEAIRSELTEQKSLVDSSITELNESYSNDSQTLRKKLESLHQHYCMLETDNQEFLKLTDELRETVRNLKRENEEKTFLLSKLQEDSMEKSVSNTKGIEMQIHLLETDRDDLKKEIEMTRVQLDQVKEERNELAQEIEKFRTRVKGQENVLSRIEELESERDELMEEMEGFRGDMLLSRKEKQTSKEEIQGLKRKIESLETERDEIGTYQTEMQSLYSENQNLKEQIDGLNWKLEESSAFEEELEEVQAQLRNLQKEKAVEQTTSFESMSLKTQESENLCQEIELMRIDLEKRDILIENLKSEVDDMHAQIQVLTEVENQNKALHIELEQSRLMVENLKSEMVEKHDMYQVLTAEVECQNKTLNSELEQSRLTMDKCNIQIGELSIRLLSLDTLEVEFSELNEQYNKSLNDNNNLAKQIEELHDRLQQMNSMEKEISLTVEQKDHFSREKDTLQERVNDLESQGSSVTDENARLKQELAEVKSSVQQLTFEAKSLKSQLEIASSSGDQMSKFQLEYDELLQQFNEAIEQKNKSLVDLNQAHYNHERREQRCQQLALQVSRLAEDRSYLNAQLGHLSKALREKESEWNTMKTQYRTLYQTHMSTQMKVVDLEKKVVTETFQKAHSPSTTTVLGRVIPDQSQIEEYKQRFEMSERAKEEAVQTMNELQKRLQAEEKRSEEIEKTLREAQDQLLLHASKPLSPEVRLQIEEDENDSRIREYNPMLTRRGMGYCRRLQRWMKVKNRQLTRIMQFRPGIRKCLWAYFVLLHILIVACFTGFI